MELNKHEESRKVRRFTRFIVVFSILFPITILTILFSAGPLGETHPVVRFLPTFHAIINSTTALLLVLAWYFIKRSKTTSHKISILMAVVLTVVFLVSYLTYHSLAGSTPYGGDEPMKYIYYFVLISHILLAAAIVPMVLISLYRALNGKYERHKRIARWAMPIWIYVAVSGVVVYFLISPYY